MHNIYCLRIPLLGLGLMGFFSACDYEHTPSRDVTVITPEPETVFEIAAIERQDEPPEPVLDNFGFDSEAFRVEQRRVQRHENLSLILQRQGVGHGRIHNISQASQGVFNLRRIVAGRPVHLYTTADTLERLSHLVYERDAVNYVVFNLDEPYTVELGERQVSSRERIVEGTISRSLYESFLEMDADPRLAYSLADVFAWQIDFYRIREGDRFKVLFDEKVIDGETVGLGRIKAADFHHRGTEFNALYFEQNGRGDYFDKEGNSLRKAFLRAPLEYSRISSRFTNSRMHPILRQNRPHHGTDYAAPTGTPIRAVGDGQIVHAAYDRNNGNFIKIRHNNKYETGYLHMSRLANGMRNGTPVSQGQIIGFVGSTGLATGPHLCYRFWRNGKAVDPYRIDFPSSNPVEDQYLTDYEDHKAGLLSALHEEPEPEPE
ncbi:MAG: peptidoglycan DD-metalloendopeptidase family protein, partial [Balneolales bacterium]